MSHFYDLIYSPVALAAAIVNFTFAGIALLRSSRGTLYRVFIAICVSVMFWNIFEFLAVYTGNHNWKVVTLICSAPIPTLMFHFIVVLLGIRVSRIWIAAPYFLSTVMGTWAGMVLVYPALNTIETRIYWEAFYAVSFSPFLIVGTVMLVKAVRGAGLKDEKSRLRYILLADLIGVITVSSDHMQAFGFPLYPLGPVGSLFYSTILMTGIFKHRTAYDILAHTRKKLELLNEMAASLVHEVRNPLGSIRGVVQLLGKRLKSSPDPKTIEFMEILGEETERLERILVSFQYFTRPMSLEKEQVDMSSLIEKTIRIARSAYTQTSINFKENGPMPAIEADPASLKQVFMNLIKNAGEAGSEVVITAAHEPPWVKIDFSDNGPGIEKERMEKIFDPFFTTKERGMGVGLSISKRIIDAHGGIIKVENLSPGGARFSILLPD